MPPIGAKHAEVVDYVNDVFSHQVGDDKRTRVQNPVQLGDYGELYPDIATLRKRRYESIQRIERGAVTPAHVPEVSLALSELFPREPEN